MRMTATPHGGTLNPLGGRFGIGEAVCVFPSCLHYLWDLMCFAGAFDC
jgi:hypothetical protein